MLNFRILISLMIAPQKSVYNYKEYNISFVAQFLQNTTDLLGKYICNHFQRHFVFCRYEWNIKLRIRQSEFIIEDQVMINNCLSC